MESIREALEQARAAGIAFQQSIMRIVYVLEN
jgi:hypothetical protein